MGFLLWLSPGRGAERKHQDTAGATAGGAVKGDGAVVVGDDVLGDRKAKPGAVALGGEEGIEDLGEMLFGNASAGICNDDPEVSIDLLCVR